MSALCVALSRRTGFPVRMTFSRAEVLQATGPRQRHGVHDQGRGPARWHHYRYPGASGL